MHSYSTDVAAFNQRVIYGGIFISNIDNTSKITTYNGTTAAAFIEKKVAIDNCDTINIIIVVTVADANDRQPFGNFHAVRQRKSTAR